MGRLTPEDGRDGVERRTGFADDREGVERRTVLDAGRPAADGRLVLRCADGRLPERAALGVERVADGRAELGRETLLGRE